MLKDADVQLDRLDYPHAIFRIASFHAKNSTDSTSVGVQR